MADRIQNRRDTKARWAEVNPILLEGEHGDVLDDPNLYKVGDGVKKWNELPFRGYDGTLVQSKGTSINSTMSQKAITDNLEFLQKEINAYIDGNVVITNTNITILGPFYIWINGESIYMSSTREVQFQSNNRQRLLFNVTTKVFTCKDYNTVDDLSNNICLGEVSPNKPNNNIIKIYNKDLNINTYRSRYATLLNKCNLSIIWKDDNSCSIYTSSGKVLTNSLSDKDIITKIQTLNIDLGGVYIIFLNISNGNLISCDINSPLITDYTNLINIGYIDTINKDFNFPFTNICNINITDTNYKYELITDDYNSNIDKGTIFIDTRNIIKAGERWVKTKIICGSAGTINLHTYNKEFKKVSTRSFECVAGVNDIEISGSAINSIDLYVAIESPIDTGAYIKTRYPKIEENPYGIKYSNPDFIYSGYKIAYSIKVENIPQKVNINSDTTNNNSKYDYIKNLQDYSESLFLDVNLFNIDTVIDGEINSRLNNTPTGIGILDNWGRSEFIPIDGGVDYTLVTSTIGTYNASLTFYDEDFNALIQSYTKELNNNITVKSPTIAKYCSFNYKINSKILENIKFYKGTGNSAYSKYLDGSSLKQTAIKQYIDNNSISIGKVSTLLSNGLLYVRSSFNNMFDIVNVLEIKTHYGNDNFNFQDTYLLNKDNIDIKNKDKVLKKALDDIAPIQLEGRTYIGGNHGIDNSIIANIPNHGKTSINYGDQYLDASGRKFYIVEIIDQNTLRFLSENIGPSEELFAFGNATGNLMKDSEIIQSTSLQQHQQLRPSTRLVSKKVLIDGEELKENVILKGNIVTVNEEYDCIYASKVLKYVIQNKTSWGYATVMEKTPYIRLINSLSFDVHGIIGTNIINVLTNANKVRYGAISFEPLNKEAQEDLLLHIPKTTSFTHGGNTYDFTKLQMWNSDFINDGWIYFDPTKYEQNKCPDRWTEYISQDGTLKYAGSAGFIQKSDGLNNNRLKNSDYPIVINSYRKCYGRVFDFKLTFDNNQQQRIFQTAWFRQFFDPTLNTNTISVNKYVFGNVLYINIDYSGFIGMDKVYISNIEEYVGKEISILEKSDNIQLVSDFLTSNGIIINKTDTSYGYITLIV